MNQPAIQPAATAAAIEPFKCTPYTLSSPPSGEHFRFATSYRTTGKFRFVWTLAPGKKGPGLHRHDHETESFEIVSGTLRIWLDGVPKDYHAGDRVDVLPGVPHGFLNPGKEPVVCNVTLDGPRLEDVFVPCAVANAQKPSPMNMMRFMANTLVSDGSTPLQAIARPMGVIVKALVWLFRARPFEPVYGWDKATSV